MVPAAAGNDGSKSRRWWWWYGTGTAPAVERKLLLLNERPANRCTVV